MAERIALIEPDWPAPATVRAVATTRTGGVSTGAYASLNLGDHVGDDARSVATNRARLREALRLPSEPLWLRQVHGISVARAEAARPDLAADAMIAATAQRICAVLTADCLPVLLCDRWGRHVAAAHAGWRGLSAGVLVATVQALQRCGVAAGDLLAWFGPGISGPAYEVGDTVRQAFLDKDPGADVGFTAAGDGRWRLDLVTVARRQLESLGVTRIYGGRQCTYRDPDRFFSHRRDGPCGRQATLIWLQ